MLGYLFNKVEDIAHRLALRHDILKVVIPLYLIPKPDVFFTQPLPFLCLLERQDDFIGIKGLGDIVIGPDFHCLNRCIDCAIGGHHDDCPLQPLFLRRLKQGHAVHLGHFYIAQDDIPDLALHLRERLLPVLGNRHLVPCFSQDHLEVVSQVLLVIDDQYPLA